MQTFWDERYRVKEYVYGTSPNEYFREKLGQLVPGTLLLPGEGEGRNAVHAANEGWKVTAFDTSIEGKKKALQLAVASNVSIDYQISSYTTFQSGDQKFDAIGLFFTHQPTEMRRSFHQSLVKSLNPGGYLIMEVFDKEQIAYTTGGPRNIDYLFDEAGLRNDFKELEILEIQTITRNLNEGPFHQGKAMVVQLFAKRL